MVKEENSFSYGEGFLTLNLLLTEFFPTFQLYIHIYAADFMLSVDHRLKRQCFFLPLFNLFNIFHISVL